MPEAAAATPADASAPTATAAGTGKSNGARSTAPEDRWTAFAGAADSPPGRLARALRATGRALIHEYTLVVVASLVLAVLMTWPTLRYPQYTIPQDIWDPTLQAWQMAWSGHILLTDPAQLWHSNTFFPERYSFAFSDALIGYAPLGMIGTGPQAALIRYNIVFVLAHALCVIGGYALVRQLGAGRVGAAVAGVVFAFAPWRLAQEGHLHIISAGGIPLAFAMLARGHGWSLRHGYRPERRRVGWVVAGWLTASWQISLGFGIGLPFAYALLLVMLVAAATYGVQALRRRRKPLGRGVLVTDLVGGAVFAAVGALLALPYFRVTELHPYAERTEGQVAFFSPKAYALLVAPAESLPWGDLHTEVRETLRWVPEMTLLPGFTLYGLAAIGLFFSMWTWRWRLVLLLGTVTSAVLSLGTQVFGGHYTYLPLFHYLPGWNGIRTPGRLIMWTTLFLAILAAGAVSEFGRRTHRVARTRIPSWPGPWLRLAMLVPLILVIAEGTNRTPHPIVPAQPAAMRTVDGPMLVLPTGAVADMNVMLWSTTKFQQMANGGSGFLPQRQKDMRDAVQTFPDAGSVQHLRSLGLKRVVLLRDQAQGTPWERAGDVPVDSLGIQREDLADAVVFHL